MADEPTAIRHPKRGKAHQSSPHPKPRGVLPGWELTACRRWVRDLAVVPLSQIPTEDRCRTCWPTTKDVTP